MINTCTCGKDKLEFMEKCADCMLENIPTVDGYVPSSQFERVNVFELPIFININYDNRIKYVQQVVDTTKLSESVMVIPTNVVHDYDDKKYNEYILVIKKDINFDVLSYVLQMLSKTRARSYDFTFCDESKINFLKYRTTEFTDEQIRALNILLLRYSDILTDLTVARIYNHKIFGETTKEMLSMTYKELIENIGLQQVAKEDCTYLIPIGRGTFNVSSMKSILTIFKNIFEIAKTLNSENIQEFKTPRLFFSKVSVNDDDCLVSRRINSSRLDLNTSDCNIDRYFGSYEYDDNYDYDDEDEEEY